MNRCVAQLRSFPVHCNIQNDINHDIISLCNSGTRPAAGYHASGCGCHGNGAFELEEGSGDAALVLTLSPDIYTAHVDAGGAAAGVTLIEVYEVQD